MKRILAAAIAIAISSLTIAPAFADDVDLKTVDGVKKFWEQHQLETGGNGGSN